MSLSGSVTRVSRVEPVGKDWAMSETKSVQMLECNLCGSVVTEHEVHTAWHVDHDKTLPPFYHRLAIATDVDEKAVSFED